MADIDTVIKELLIFRGLVEARLSNQEAVYVRETKEFKAAFFKMQDRLDKVETCLSKFRYFSMGMSFTVAAFASAATVLIQFFVKP